MERREFVVATAIGSVGVGTGQIPLGGAMPNRDADSAPEKTPVSRSVTAGRKILIAGGGFNTAFIRYMAQLTGKPRPRMLYLPTASADSPAGTIAWFRNCAPLNVEASVQNSFIESLSQKQSWEEVLLSADGIVCSGGNTLNQQAIWKAQGIDAVLRKAWDQGIVLGGASAGSLCWFEEGTTDSRPKELTVVKCLGFLKGSHSPHYDAEVGRRPLYHKLIGSGQMQPGYACDNDAGLYFEDNEIKRIVSARVGAKCYHVTTENGKVVEHVLQPDMIT